MTYVVLAEAISDKMASFRVAPKIKELRILLCQTSKSSEGARNFVEQHYVTFKKANPKLPCLIRECSNIQPRLYVRAEYGKETCIPLKDLQADDIVDKLKKATT